MVVKEYGRQRIWSSENMVVREYGRQRRSKIQKLVVHNKHCFCAQVDFFCRKVGKHCI